MRPQNSPCGSSWTEPSLPVALLASGVLLAGPPLRRAPCRPGQRRQHTKCRRRHHHRPQLHRMTALRAPKADHSEDPPEQVTPRAPARLSRRVSRQSPPDRRRSLLCLRWRRSNARPKPRTRRENTVIVNLVRPRRWHQRHQSFHQLQPAELQRRRPIAPCALQLNSNPAIWQRLEREPAVFFRQSSTRGSNPLQPQRTKSISGFARAAPRCNR